MLIPVILWLDAAPATVNGFAVINVKTGLYHTLSTSLIDRVKRSDNSRTWYLFDGSDIGQTLPCGTYKIRLRIGSAVYLSDEIQVVNAPGQETISLTTGSCISFSLDFTASDTIASAINSERFEYRRTSATNWTNLAPSSTMPNVYDFDLAPKNLAGDNYLIRRTVITDAGLVLQSFYSMTWGAVDPCGDYVFTLIDEQNTYPDVWYLEISDSVKWEDKVYSGGFKERIYFRGYWDFPEPEREIEVLTDNQANAVLNTADTREFLVMAIAKVADHLTYKLTALGDYSTISLVNPFSGYTITGIPGAETEF
ncbi:MAG: hypothetical protein KDK34_20240, partial [Leptospiraceae bacterium]|nr:hypothetical protein [Leptospiraceae bacterium]